MRSDTERIMLSKKKQHEYVHVHVSVHVSAHVSVHAQCLCVNVLFTCI